MSETSATGAAQSGSSFRTALAVWIVFGACAALALAAVTLFGPGEGTVCLIRAATGVACPACGMTRAAALMMHGDLAGAFAIHPLGPIVIAEAVIAWIAWGASLAIRRRGLDEAKLLALMWANLGVLVVVWVVRLIRGTLPA